MCGGGGWVGLGEGLTWSPTHGPRCLPCRTRLGSYTRVSGHKAYWTVDRPQTPRWRSRAGDAAVPVCMCPGVSGGGRAEAHLLAPLLFGVGAHGTGKCVPGAPGLGREAGEPDAEPARGDVGLGSQPPRHKDKLPNYSTTACWHRKVVVRGTTGVRPALLDCLRHRWCCHVGWVRLPTAEWDLFSDTEWSSHVVTAHFFCSALCHPAAPALLQCLTATVINSWELCNAE